MGTIMETIRDSEDDDWIGIAACPSRWGQASDMAVSACRTPRCGDANSPLGSCAHRGSASARHHSTMGRIGTMRQYILHITCQVKDEFEFSM